MTTLREAAQQALEALELVTDLTNHDDEIYDAIDTLRAALVEEALQKFTDVNQELEAALAEHDKNLAGFKERKANWDIRAPRSPRDLQCKLAEETQERDKQQREYEEQRLAALAEPDWQDLYLKEKKRADMWRDKYESVAGAEQRIHPLAEPVQQGCDHCNSPLYAAVKCRVCGRVTSAEPVQEPVAYSVGRALHWHQGKGVSNAQLFAAPPRPKPLTEEEQPVCDECGKHKRDGWALYCVGCVEPMFAPPTLTDDQLDDIAVAARRGNLYDLRIAIERAHETGGSDD